MASIVLRTAADVGALIKGRRQNLGMDQAELAAKAGVSRLWIGQVERGKPGASLALVLRTLAVLQLEITGQTDSVESTAMVPLPIRSVDINEIVRAARGGKKQ